MDRKSLESHKARKLILFCFHLAWGIGLWWSVSANGLGTSRDSVEYLFTSMSLTKGDGFISFAGGQFVLWPPLYPILLSMLQSLGISDPLKAALILQLVTFVWLAVLFTWLFVRLFPENFSLAFLGNSIMGTGVALTMLFQAVCSDYLFLALVLSFIYFCDKYIVDNKISALWFMTIINALAMLQRYIGVALLLTGVWIVFQYTRMKFWKRSGRLFLLGLSALPLGIWILSLPVEALVRGAPSSLLENFYSFTFSILSWFIPYPELYGHPVRLQVGTWGLWVSIFMGSFLLWKFHRRYSSIESVKAPLLLFGLIYSVTLLMIASLSSFNTLDSRFASPVFIPLIVLALTTVDMISQLLKHMKKTVRVILNSLLYVPLLIALGLSVYQSISFMQIHAQQGSGYTSKDWNNHPVIQYWETHLPNGRYLVFSNYPAGVAVHTWVETLASPRRTAHPNAGEVVIPLDTYIPLLLAPDRNSYLVWIEPNEYTHVYGVDDLWAVVNIETIYEDENGGVYRILPQHSN